MYPETIPAAPMPAAMRQLLARDAWQDHGTARTAAAWYAEREWLLLAISPSSPEADIVNRAAYAELDDPAPSIEEWTR